MFAISLNRLHWIFAGTLLFAVLAAVAYSPRVLAEEPRTLKIGVAYGFTGPAEQWSKYGRMGLKLAAKEINEKGGVNGRQLKLIFEDTQTKPFLSVTAYRKLVGRDKIDVFVGDIWDFVTQPIIPLSRKDNMPHLSTVVPWTIKVPGNHFFTFGYDLETARPALEKFFSENPGVRTVSIFCWDSSWGHPYLEMWKDVAAKKGVKVLNEICINDFAHDYRADVTRVASRKPDAVIIAHQSERILRRMRELKFKPVVLSTSNFLEPFTDGVISAESSEGVYFTDWYPAAEFISKFTKEYGVSPKFEAHNHYEIVRSIARAFKRNPKSLLDGLRLVEYEGYGGKITFKDSFAVQSGRASLMRVVGGKIEKVG